MKLNKIKYTLLSIIGLFSISLQIVVKAQAGQTADLLKIQSSEQNNLILELSIPQFEKKTKLFQGKEFDILNIPEFTQSCLPGKPQLPVRGYLFGVPLDGVTSVEILETEFKIFSPINIFYTPKITYDADLSVVVPKVCKLL